MFAWKINTHNNNWWLSMARKLHGKHAPNVENGAKTWEQHTFRFRRIPAACGLFCSPDTKRTPNQLHMSRTTAAAKSISTLHGFRHHARCAQEKRKNRLLLWWCSAGHLWTGLKSHLANTNMRCVSHKWIIRLLRHLGRVCLCILPTSTPDSSKLRRPQPTFACAFYSLSVHTTCVPLFVYTPSWYIPTSSIRPSRRPSLLTIWLVIPMRCDASLWCRRAIIQSSLRNCLQYGTRTFPLRLSAEPYRLPIASAFDGSKVSHQTTGDYPKKQQFAPKVEWNRQLYACGMPNVNNQRDRVAVSCVAHKPNLSFVHVERIDRVNVVSRFALAFLVVLFVRACVCVVHVKCRRLGRCLS